jgi:hypothetical protein
MRIVERIGGHYEAQEVEFGMVYTWRSESLMAECKCTLLGRAKGEVL